MVVQHNLSAMNSHRYLGINNSQTAGNLEKLSSGYKINRAADDAAGLAISEKMRGQIRGLAMAEQNTKNAVDLIQTAEGGLSETHSILQRMRELAVQSSNGTYQDDDRTQITLEFEALKSEVDRIAESIHYNGIKLLNGSLSEAQSAKVVKDLNSVVKEFTMGQFTGAVAGDTLRVQLGTITVTKGVDGKAQVMTITITGTNGNGGSDSVANTAGEVLTIQVGNEEIKVTLQTRSMTAAAVAAEVAAALQNYADANGNKFSATSNEDGEVLLIASETGTESALSNLSVSAASSNVKGASLLTSAGVDATADSYTMELTKGSINATSDSIANLTDNNRYIGTTVSAMYNASNNTWVITDDVGISITLDASKIPMPTTSTLTAANPTAQNKEAAKIQFDVVIQQGNNLTFQIGANGGQDQRVSLSVGNMDSKSLGLKLGNAKSDGSFATAFEAANLASANINTRETANKAIEIIHAASNQVSAQRAELGALQNRLESTLNSLGVAKENLTSAESTIRDVDMAKEMMEFTKNNILVQASQAMLAQANQLPQGVLNLLR